MIRSEEFYVIGVNLTAAARAPEHGVLPDRAIRPSRGSEERIDGRSAAVSGELAPVRQPARRRGQDLAVGVSQPLQAFVGDVRTRAVTMPDALEASMLVELADRLELHLDCLQTT
ncbi:MAG: hypothetical protein ACT4OP_03680 [Actinomycetota bacterium]